MQKMLLAKHEHLNDFGMETEMDIAKTIAIYSAFTGWWTKLKGQAKGGNQEPLLFFKYNRSPIFVVTEIVPMGADYNCCRGLRRPH